MQRAVLPLDPRRADAFLEFRDHRQPVFGIRPVQQDGEFVAACFQKLGLEGYIGVPLTVEGQIFFRRVNRAAALLSG